MKNIEILDNYVDNREFRNYVSNLLSKFGYDGVAVDDTRISDNDKNNDNDIIAIKDCIKYTVQTFLNIDVSEKEINETIKDMKKENTAYGLIVTNKEVDEKIRKIALENGIEIIDRNDIQKVS